MIAGLLTTTHDTLLRRVPPHSVEHADHEVTSSAYREQANVLQAFTKEGLIMEAGQCTAGVDDTAPSDTRTQVRLRYASPPPHVTLQAPHVDEATQRYNVTHSLLAHVTESVLFSGVALQFNKLTAAPVSCDRHVDAMP